MFIGVIKPTHGFLVVHTGNTERMQRPEGKRGADLLYGLFSISLKSWSCEVSYVWHCLWPFVDLTHLPKHGTKHLQGTKDFMWCRKVTEAAPHVWVLDRNLSGSAKENHALYQLKLWWLMRGFMVRGRHWSVYQSINILFLLQHCPALYLSVEREWHVIQDSLGIWWKIPWEHEH